ncbi:MAG: ABC transporter ATP-binding protein [Anaerolineae bacterium]|nr:ABC transporter ATP-binding protein [Anaerolineae bacterium]
MAILLRLLRYMKSHPWLLAMLFASLFAGLGAELALPRALGLVIDRGITAGSMQAVMRYIGLLAAVAITRASLRYSQAYSQERLGQEIIRRLRHDLFARLQRLSFSYYTMHATGDEMAKLTSDVYAVMDFIGFGVAEMSASTLVFVGTLVALCLVDWPLALAVISPIPPLMFVAFRFSGLVGPIWEQIRAEMGKLTTTLQENISGVRVVKAFAKQDHEMDKFRGRNRATLSAHLQRAGIESRTFPVLNFITGFCFLILFWYGGRRVYAGQLSLGDFFAFNWYLWGLIWPVRFLGFLIGIARKAIAAGPRIFSILDSDMEIEEAPEAVELAPLEGRIHFEQVCFAFEDGDGSPVLCGLDLDLAPGEVVAVLGRTGSGKSSLVNLIPRFYDPQSGCISIDGQDIRGVTLASLRRQIGIVPQETFLFSDTVRNNIAYGRPDATLEEVEAAARAAQAHGFIAELPKGYDTRIGERGVGLSGGQRQRIAIARALLTDPRILILDEPTSSVDAETESALQVALARLMRGRTSLVIAQRLSTVKHAHRVVVLKDGAVVEQGTHAELLALGGEYTQIYELQLKQQETA